MADAFVEDIQTGIISTGTNSQLEYADPARTTPLDYYTKTRSLAWIYIPQNGANYEIILRSMGRDTVVASGIARVSAAGRTVPIQVAIKVLPDIPRPIRPIAPEPVGLEIL